MSGVHAVMAAGSAASLTVGVASTGAIFGAIIDSGFGTPMGSVSPASFKGATIEYVVCSSSGARFRIDLDGTRAQNFFTSVTVQDSDGNFVKLLSADATFFDSTPQGTTAWLWSGTNLWNTTHAARSVLIHY